MVLGPFLLAMFHFPNPTITKSATIHPSSLLHWGDLICSENAFLGLNTVLRIELSFRHDFSIDCLTMVLPTRGETDRPRWCSGEGP